MWQLTSVDSGKVLRMTPFEILENNFYTGCSNGKKKKLILCLMQVIVLCHLRILPKTKPPMP